MLRVDRFSRRTDSPTPGNWRNVKKKIENRNPYITYLENLDKNSEWHITANSEEKTYFDIVYEFVKYEKKK